MSSDIINEINILNKTNVQPPHLNRVPKHHKIILICTSTFIITVILSAVILSIVKPKFIKIPTTPENPNDTVNITKLVGYSIVSGIILAIISALTAYFV